MAKGMLGRVLQSCLSLMKLAYLQRFKKLNIP
uniref:5'-3' exoribonuclease 3-like isoform X1 n=1 Tax=Rhizophora mucronata TaxID=61149 RepID=A0A2P2M107_RHIMU